MSTPYLGEIRLFGFGGTPVGWQVCDGSLLPIAGHAALHALLGTTYGGDGQATFGVPDLRGRVPVHRGHGRGLTDRALGQTFGVETVTLGLDQLPGHTHSISASNTVAASLSPAGAVMGATVGFTQFVTATAQATQGVVHPDATPVSGGAGRPHENCMPTLPVNFCIATEGIYPSPT